MLRICPGYKSRSPGKALCAAPGEDRILHNTTSPVLNDGLICK
ncbi:hypothetical protein CSC12_2411 [Klebsiella michiganensis]|nr:hypothetical protein CSC12_2411 [Klebsiella michiganensis]